MLTRNLVNNPKQEASHEKIQKVSDFESSCSRKKVQFYVNWVSKFYFSCKKVVGASVNQKKINAFLRDLSKHCEEWQINQASDAIHLYLFHQRRGSVTSGWKNAQPNQAWKAASDELVRMLRLRRRTLSTERVYLTWLRAFYRFVKGKSPAKLDNTDAKDVMISEPSRSF